MLFVAVVCVQPLCCSNLVQIIMESDDSLCSCFSCYLFPHSWHLESSCLQHTPVILMSLSWMNIVIVVNCSCLQHTPVILMSLSWMNIVVVVVCLRAVVSTLTLVVDRRTPVILCSCSCNLLSHTMCTPAKNS